MKNLKEFFEDKLMKAKIAFYSSVALEFEPILRDFQSTEPKLPFLFTSLLSVLKTLLSRIIRSSIMDD